MHPLSEKSISLDAYRTGRYMVFDMETTNLEYGNALNPDNRIIVTAWKLQGEEVQHCTGNLLECRGFWEDLESADYLVAHNAKFESKWLLRLGYDPTEKLWADTMLAEYVRLGNRRSLLNLGAVSERYGFKGKDPLIDTMMRAGICPSEMPETRLINRCRRDVITTGQLWEKLRKGLDESNRLGVLLTRCLTAPILAVIESEGMHLDSQRVRETYDEYSARLAELRREIDEFTGGINPNSTDQMAEFLYHTLKFPEKSNKRGQPIRNKPSKRWPEGKPKTDKDTRAWLDTQATTARQKKWIALRQEYGRVNAAVTKNLEFFKGVVEEREGAIFYGQFNQINTGTHRLSSSGIPQQFKRFPKPKSVQFQNMPRDFKKLFKSRDPDYWFVDTDASQLEFRVAVDLTGDPQGHKDIRDPGFDAHVYSASILFNKDYDELFQAAKVKGDKAAKGLRQDAKPETYKPLYGGTKGTPEQERYYHDFQHKRYKEMFAHQMTWVSEVSGTGRLITPWGLRFYWETYINPNTGTLMDKRTHKPANPQIFNYPVQSLATAEIVPISVVYLFYRAKKAGLRVRFVNSVHDSLPAEVHKDDIEQYRQQAVKAFTTDVYRYMRKVYGYEVTVPLGMEMVWGTNWGVGEEFSIDVEPSEVM